MMVLTESESDAILVEPMKNRTSGEMIRVYQVLINRLRSAGIAPKQHILDNKCSNNFKEAIKTNNMTYQLVPPQEQIRKGNPNVQGQFCGNSLWHRHFFSVKPLGPTITPSRTHPQHVATLKHDSHSISLHVPLGQHDYNANPFAPL